MLDRDRSAIETCLSLPEIVYQVGSHLFEPRDLYAASCTNRLWNAALLPIRSNFPHVALENLPSFLSFLKSNRRAAHHCRALRVLCDNADDEVDSDSDSDSDIDMDREVGEAEDNNNSRSLVKKSKRQTDSNPIVGVINHLAEHGKLQFFMYALPGEPCVPLPDDVFLVLRRMSETLQGLYIELVIRHWNVFLSSRFSNLNYLRLFLDSDEVIPANSENGAFDSKAALLAFLQSHPRLEVLHLYLGTCFDGLALSTVRLPLLRSFLLISKAENVDAAPFIDAHTGLTSLDIYTDTNIVPFSADSLPNIQALQVSAMTVPWFTNILAAAPQRARPIRHLQITAARQEIFRDVLRCTSPLGEKLRCLELIFWSRDVPLLKVLEDVSRTFPKLVELSLFIPSWGSAEWAEEDKPLELASMLQCFVQNTDLLAFAVSDPKTEMLDKEQIQAVPNSSVPPRLRYIIWRSQTFRIDRRSADGAETVEAPQKQVLYAERTYHPRNLRGSRYLRDWHEEMAFDHLAGDYEAQLQLC